MEHLCLTLAYHLIETTTICVSSDLRSLRIRDSSKLNWNISCFPGTPLDIDFDRNSANECRLDSSSSCISIDRICLLILARANFLYSSWCVSFEIVRFRTAFTTKVSETRRSSSETVLWVSDFRLPELLCVRKLDDVGFKALVTPFVVRPTPTALEFQKKQQYTLRKPFRNLDDIRLYKIGLTAEFRYNMTRQKYKTL